MARRPVLEFWYEFASTYSYLAALRIERLAEAAGVDVRWRPFLLGPIFAAQGWTTSPFNLYPAKGRHMWRDLEREAAASGCRSAGRTPSRRTASSPPASRSSAPTTPGDRPSPRRCSGPSSGRGARSPSRRRSTPSSCTLGLDADGVLRQAQGEPNKARLKAQTEEARSRGVFGAPTFFAEDGEMFWGNDRLEQALAWASGERP